ncbi:MAG: 50S ribosomal protein L13 [Flavobacteriales bacterium]
MDTLSYKTLSANKETANKQWFIVDAENQILGRMSSKIAKILRGKYKTNFTPHADCGDYVIVINADKAIMTGRKMENREIFSHTGYPGGQKRITPIQMLEKDGTSVVKHAIKGMLPKNKLGAAILKNLYIYTGTEYEQEAQKPTLINLNDLK